LRFGFGLAISAEFGKQPAAACWKQCESLGVEAFTPGVIHEQPVHAFESDWLVCHDVRHAVGAFINIGISNHQKDTFRRTFYQTASGFQHRHARAFRAH
jgi:hypothetical protein